MGGNVGQLIISGLAAGYGNTNWYFDDTQPLSGIFTNPPSLGALAETMVQSINPSASIIYSNTQGSSSGTAAGHITEGLNIAGFYSFGLHGYYGDTNGGYAVNGTIQFTGQSGWYVIDTDESFNGERYEESQGNFLEWFSSNAFGGTGYSNTPIGAGSNVDEPGSTSCNPPQFFGYWAAGKSLAICAWNSQIDGNAPKIQVIGDPFTKQ